MVGVKTCEDVCGSKDQREDREELSSNILKLVEKILVMINDINFIIVILNFYWSCCFWQVWELAK